VSPTAKHDAVEASRPQTGSIPYLQHIDPPGPAVRWQSAAWCTDATKEQLAQTVAPASIDSTRFAHRARCERSNCFATGSRRAIKRPTYTGNNRLSEFVPQFHKTADKPANGSALTLLRDRCGLYGLGALGSSAFLDRQCGLSQSFARRFVSHCRSLIRSGNHLPPTIRQKKNKAPPASLFRAFHWCALIPAGIGAITRRHCRIATTWHRRLVGFQQRVRTPGAPPWR
jgi:hypothetical protein